MLAFTKTSLLTLVVVLLATSNSYAVIRHDGSDDQDYINLGNQFPSTIWLGYETHFRGSAVVIDEHWVICSAHQMFDSQGNMLDQFFIGTGPNALTEPGDYFIPNDWLVHPDYVHGGIGDTPDIALLYFEDAIEGVTPASLFDGTPNLGDLVTQVGYGQPGTPSLGMLDSDYQRRGCQNLIDSFGIEDWKPDYFAITEFPPLGVPGYQPLGGVGAPGDSGGGFYIGDDIFAIAAFQIGSPGYYSNTGATMIHPFRDWIDSTMTSVPEPSSFVMLLLGGLTLLALRRRRG